MNLILDIGNTQYKICIYEADRLCYQNSVEKLQDVPFANLAAQFSLKQGIFSDTRGVEAEVRAWVGDAFPLLELTQFTKVPLQINYETPNTLGKDRLAAAVGAWRLFPEQPSLIIDIGTAMTVDFVSEAGVYEGGVISPGPELRYRALSSFTGKLPYIEASTDDCAIWGKNTEQSIRSGVQNGLLYEINAYIEEYRAIHQNIKVILTGGYAYLFDKKINYPIFAEFFLVPGGLNTILNYNNLG